MPVEFDLRETTPDDTPQVLALYPKAFPEEDLTGIVGELLALDKGVLSLGAFLGEALVGHAIFTFCSTADDSGKAALLGPLCVGPQQQHAGIGTALVKTGLERLKGKGIAAVFVLGDPNYYQRFGFVAESAVQPPYPLPTEWAGAWQSLSFAKHAPLKSGQLRLPEPWMQPAYWGP